MKQFLLLLASISILSSCKIVVGLVELNKDKAKVYSYRIDNKEIIFLPMHHLGKKEFYDDVRKKVDSLKQNGFVVYYELIRDDVKLDHLQTDTLKRKWRKIIGFGGTFKDAANEMSLHDQYIQQPKYPDLGTTENDINADVNRKQFIDEWEKQNGKIVLDSVDFITPLNENVPSEKISTRKQRNNVILKYRNEYVSNLIKTSSDKKILIIYGASHRKGMIKLLKR